MDAEGNYIILRETGYAIYEREYNHLWQIGQKSYYGADGKRINYWKKKAAIIEYTYDDWGYFDIRTYYDANNHNIEV